MPPQQTTWVEQGQNRVDPCPHHLPDPITNAADENSRIEVKNTICYMCACHCGIHVTLRDDEVRYIEGNPGYPLNKGVICAKGASGILKQYSPARLTKPLLRKPGSRRGDNKFDEISWGKIYELPEQRLAHIRETDPKKFALITGCDQMRR